MIKSLALSSVAEYCRDSLNAELRNGDAVFTTVNTDTRKLIAGDLFVALRGDNFDAHNFLDQAAAQGVCGLVVENFSPQISLPQLVVSDTLLALGQIAAMNRNAFKGPVLAITGSSGKTTVKTMLACILEECGKVHATKGNLNNHIGVPLTLLQLDSDHEFAVVEMGASAIGEIAYLCSLARPQVTMINNVMPAHIAGFGSIDGVAQAKGEIYRGLAGDDTAVVNIDDKYSTQWLAAMEASVLRVSLTNTAADCFARNLTQTADSVAFELVLQSAFISVQLNIPGEHSVRNALMAAAMASAVGATLPQIQRGLQKFSPVSGRMSRHQSELGAVVIDDSYNANPGSVRAAMDVLAASNGRRIFVLGDLGELGDAAEQLHRELGEYAKQKNLDQLFTLGVLSRKASEAFAERALHFSDRDQLIAQLKTLAIPGTTILIKGSRSAKMDLVVNALCAIGDTH